MAAGSIKDGVDLYPEVKRRSKEQGYPENDKVRHEIMHRFGYYVTESSEHNAEYMPYFIKDKYPELIERFNIPLDEYPRRCIRNIEEWAKMREDLIDSPDRPMKSPESMQQRSLILLLITNHLSLVEM